jgi:3-hydroxypropanoate dehydrogenase
VQNQSAARNASTVGAPISDAALDQLFRQARTHSAWRSEPVPTALLRKAYELARLGPTSANSSPRDSCF